MLLAPGYCRYSDATAGQSRIPDSPRLATGLFLTPVNQQMEVQDQTHQVCLLCLRPNSDMVYTGIPPNCKMPHYTPDIYAEGYIVFVFQFFRLSVCMFVRTSVTFVEFASKFLKWCISQQLLTRKHSYLDHSYLGEYTFTP